MLKQVLDSALRRAVDALLRRQSASGEWEGEVVWGPMLAAQYVLLCQITGTAIPAARRDLLLLQFRRTRLGSGLWGLHAHSPPYLFVTTLVYVAARLLGRSRDDPLLVPAARFIAAEGGVLRIPSWGKFWLAMLNLYDWEGLHPLLPELWALPRRLPIHPGRFYCHTRLIYLAMSVIYASRHQIPRAPVIEALRAELYPAGYGGFREHRGALRAGDLYARPGRALRCLYAFFSFVEQRHSAAARRKIVERLLEHIRWEFRTTDHTAISPVSGLLSLIALWIHQPDDPDLHRALVRFEGWIWEDGRDGTRVAGARSASWDTAFALQALAAVEPHASPGDSIARGVSFLTTQQIRRTFPGVEENFRIDPRGGWCFAGVWHGWPVSDCTAEALLALLAAPAGERDSEALREGIEFILRCQNADGGFGSYEPSGTRWSLEWLNPAEMFADSMTDRSWVECTSSCISALATFRQSCPGVLDGRITRALEPAARWLAARQRSDGAWPGAWGVYLIYGTLFGVRGLLAAGTPVFHPAIRKACRWLLARQRPDGGWGEHHSGCLAGVYVEHRESQVIQTAWALLTLLEAHEPDWSAIERGVDHLLCTQDSNGEWPAQDWTGVFFRTALLDYTLYRRYFPLWALALYKNRCAQRLHRGEMRTFAGHSGPVRGVAVSPDGRWAVSASDDQTLKVWDLATGAALRTLAGHSGPVRGVAVSPDGRWAVSASDDQTLKVWDLATGAALRTLAGHVDRVLDVAVSEVARRTWQEKLDYYLAEDAKSSDPEQKFKLHEAIEEARAKLAELASRKTHDPASPAVHVSLEKLPASGPNFLGREAELKLLDEAWADGGRTQVVVLVAPGGLGKTTLVKRWLDRLKSDGWRGAERVYGWSFYSQGTSDHRQASDDAFLNDALRWFGVEHDLMLSPWDKGRLLAGAIARSRILLVLDGLEPLQHPPGPQGGALRAPGVQALLRALAGTGQPGLCVVTTREAIGDLAEYERTANHPAGGVIAHDLGNLADSDGARLLHKLGVTRAGAAAITEDDAELRAASREVRGHPLALTQLGRSPTAATSANAT